MASNSKNLAELLNGDITVTATDIADGSVTTAKIADSNITTSKIADSNITTAKIASGAVEGAMVAPSSHRRLNINGNFAIDQERRGVAHTGKSVYGDYFADMWRTGGGTVDGVYSIQSVQSHHNDTKHDHNYDANADIAGFKTAGKFTTTTATTNNGGAFLSHFVHMNDMNQLQWGTSSAKTATLSFWMRSNVTGKHCAQLHNNLGGADYYSYFATWNVPSANTWQYVTLTITPPTTREDVWVESFGTSRCLRIDFVMNTDTSSGDGTGENAWVNGSSDYIPTDIVKPNKTLGSLYLTGVQFEEGSVATPYEQRSEAEELLRCYRNYWQVGAPIEWVKGNGPTDTTEYSPNTHMVNFGVIPNNTNRIPLPMCPTLMRYVPSMTGWDFNTGNTGQSKEFSAGTVRTIDSWGSPNRYGASYMQLTASSANGQYMVFSASSRY